MEWIRIIPFFLLGVANGKWASSAYRREHAFEMDREVKETVCRDEEGGRCYRGGLPDDSGNYAPKKPLPEEINWVTIGAVTPIKEEGPYCDGSSWAFSATGALEGQYFRKTGKLEPLSEQHLIDCSGLASPENEEGCSWGTHYSAYHYVLSRENGPRHGVAKANAYPYTGRSAKCRFKQQKTPIVGSMILSKTVGETEEHLAEAVATIGPIAAKMYAPPSFINFKGKSIFYEKNCTSIEGGFDQHVLVVGYGRKGSENYWIIKNSWGTDWGDKGYALLAKGRNNTCGIADDPIYPVLK